METFIPKYPPSYIELVAEFKETYSSASSFLSEFPDMRNYVQSSRNSAEIIERANIVIVNARNILGWKSDNNSYNVNIKCIVDDPRMHELNNVKDNQKQCKR